jgi:GntR family transcriptional regulator/MocR family aminotransferase
LHQWQHLNLYGQTSNPKAAVLFGYAVHTPSEIRENIPKFVEQIKKVWFR